MFSGIKWNKNFQIVMVEKWGYEQYFIKSMSKYFELSVSGTYMPILSQESMKVTCVRCLIWGSCIYHLTTSPRTLLMRKLLLAWLSCIFCKYKYEISILLLPITELKSTNVCKYIWQHEYSKLKMTGLQHCCNGLRSFSWLLILSSSLCLNPISINSCILW